MPNTCNAIVAAICVFLLVDLVFFWKLFLAMNKFTDLINTKNPSMPASQTKASKARTIFFYFVHGFAGSHPLVSIHLVPYHRLFVVHIKCCFVIDFGFEFFHQKEITFAENSLLA